MPPAYRRKLAEEMPNCRYRELDDAAHLAMLDRPDAVSVAIEAFLTEIS